MNKHRPGPWTLCESSIIRHGQTEPTQICEIFCNRNNKLIAEMPDCCYHADDVEQDRADARLISAAPELLSALEEVFIIGSRLVKDTYGYDFYEKAMAAINKAKGIEIEKEDE